MRTVCGKGINDMPKGWISENEWNKKVYNKWSNMLMRCYSEKYHKRQPSYVGCLVCDDWLILSNFVRDFKLIYGYDKEKFLSGELELDKDIKSNGINKIYSLENCMLTSKTDNVKQANKTRDNSYMQNENHPLWGKHHSEESKKKMSKSHSIKIAQYDKQGKLIKIWSSSIEIEHEMGIAHNTITACCKWYECGENLEEWHKIRKCNPYKSTGGFIFKYYKEED